MTNLTLGMDMKRDVLDECTIAAMKALLTVKFELEQMILTNFLDDFRACADLSIGVPFTGTNPSTHVGSEYSFRTLVRPSEYKKIIGVSLYRRDFVHFAEICFKNFGDRVKYWTTINEPNLVVESAYMRGIHPPGHCSPPFGNCYTGNSDVEPLIAMHNMLLSHAKAVKLYRKHFQFRGKTIESQDESLISKPLMLIQAKQGGSIGIVAHAFMYEPLRDEECDRQAVNRTLAFGLPWENNLIKGSLDFIGINHYGTLYAKDCSLSACPFGADHPISGFVETTGTRDGIPIGDQQTGMLELFVVPKGMEKIVDYIKIRYHNMPVYITENADVTMHDLLQDFKRIDYHKAYLAALLRAIRKFRLSSRLGGSVRVGAFNHPLIGRRMAKPDFRACADLSIGVPFAGTNPSTHVGSEYSFRTLVRPSEYKKIIGVSLYSSLEIEDEISISQFPKSFIFGASTSSYQNDNDGHEWPLITMQFDQFSGNINNDENGDVADDHYHRYLSFGDRVKYWVTINEPNLYADMAFIRGTYPPGHCSPPFGNCHAGNSDVEPLIAMHNMLLSHAKAVQLYRKHFQLRGERIKGQNECLICKRLILIQAKQGGIIGIVAHTFMYEPLRDEERDREAVKRALAFVVAWCLDPLVFGDYPAEMRSILGSELPRFSLKEKSLIKGSLDFIGINNYGTLYAKDCSLSSCPLGTDRPIRGFVETTGTRDGIPIGDQTGAERFFVVPRGMEKIVDYIMIRYHNMPMYITENGYSPPLKPNVTIHDLLQDFKRIEFHKAYLAALLRAIRKGADVRGYMIWSLMDNFEWASGYDIRFGLYYVDRHTLERIPKLSVQWFSSFLNNTIRTNITEDLREQYVRSKVVIQKAGSSNVI
uniref:Beta-glucosidase 6 n=1 Tax=Cajanus cajan TaxID=3821 RepID=A0A151RES7_CAJCA|nr:Beta-glucosidase 6 [Cajanus cajan]